MSIKSKRWYENQIKALMSIKSKKWYENQIKALENATSKLHLDNSRMLEIYHNDIAGGFAAIKETEALYNRLNMKLGDLKQEYNLYYRG